MPQMMPLPWLLLLISVTALIFLFMTKTYFMPFLKKSSSSLINKNNSLNWLW